ncbi:MAG: RluA family pseudouridine synthase [Burkholderiaceae bacterium]
MAEAGDAQAGMGRSKDPPDSVRLQAVAARGERLDRFLAARLPQYSRTRLQRWIDLGAVSCDERLLGRATRLAGHESILVEPQPLEADRAFVAEPVEFDVRYQDDQVLVVSKQAGLVVHPGAGNWHGTLMNGLLHRFAKQAMLPRAGIVHRLDKETSGLLVVARTEAARQHLIGQLADRSMSRRYLAVCLGRVAAPTDIDAPIGRDPRNRLRMATSEAGKPARTIVRPLAEGSLEQQPVTLVHCQLHSGRTHQIRVHCAHIGHPLIGDVVYGGPVLAGFGRQALHAYRLAFMSPGTGDGGPFIEPLPDDMRRLLATAGIDAALVEAGLADTDETVR